MFNQRAFKFDCSQLLDEIEMAFQELCDYLDLPYTGRKHQLMRTALAYLLEDTVNALTDPKFRDHVTLTKNLIENYLGGLDDLDEKDKEEIDEIFVRPLIAETQSLTGKLFKNDLGVCYDRYYSKWGIRETDNFPVMEVLYLGDYRIQEWHKIQDVPSRAVVAIKRHRIRFMDIRDAVEEALRNVSDLAHSDVTIIMDLLFNYYASKQLDEHYKELVTQIKIINGFRQNADSTKALKQLKSIIKNVESIPNFKRFIDDAEIAEMIYTNHTTNRVVFDVVMPSKNLDAQEQRTKVLEELNENGFVKGGIDKKVEIIYG